MLTCKSICGGLPQLRHMVTAAKAGAGTVHRRLKCRTACRVRSRFHPMHADGNIRLLWGGGALNAQHQRQIPWRQW